MKKLIDAIPEIQAGALWRFPKEGDWRTKESPIYAGQLQLEVELAEPSFTVTKSQLADAFDMVIAHREPGNSDRSKVFKSFLEKLGVK